MRRRTRNNKQTRIVMLSVAVILLIMTTGYAAFSLQINIGAKGNVKDMPAAQQLTKSAAKTNDGLTADEYEAGRYIYKGTEPNNYITFNDETWRILSVEADGTFKIIRNESIGNFSWDIADTRDSETSTYCLSASESGCNAWSATASLVGTPSDFTLHFPNGNVSSDIEMYSGVVTADSSLNTYLNNEYYNSLSVEAKNYIVAHDFNVGTPGSMTDTESIETNMTQETLYKWNGKVGLMTVTEMLKSTMNTSCTSLTASYGSENVDNCNTNNWLWTSSNEWTISPLVTSTCSSVWLVNASGYMDEGIASDTYGVRPVVYLKADINLSGSGIDIDPYIISEK